MIILLHVLLAISSLAWTTYLYFRPSKLKFYPSYGLVAATLASGTYLVISTHSPLLSSCTTGLIYTGIVTTQLIAANNKFGREKKEKVTD